MSEINRRIRIIDTSIKSNTIHNERQRTYDILFTVLFEKIPLNKRIPHCLILAPSPNTSGGVYRAFRSRRVTKSTPIVYLSPMLELESPRQIAWTIAEELAHLALGHHKLPKNHRAFRGSYKKRPIEKQAKGLVKKWGFKNPGKSTYVEIMNFYVENHPSMVETRKSYRKHKRKP